MTNDPTDKLRALFLAALMVLSVFAFTISFAGTAAAANSLSLANSDSDAHLDSGTTFWQGQDLLIDRNGHFADDATLEVRRVNDDNELSGLAKQFQLDGKTKNISTSDLDAGDYIITDGTSTIVNVSNGNVVGTTNTINSSTVGQRKFEIAVQSLSAEFDSDDLPVDSGETATIEMDSNRGTYTVNVSASGLDEDDLEEIFNRSDSSGPENDVVDASLTDEDDNDDASGDAEGRESIQINTSADGDIEANFSVFDETGDFTFDFDVSDTTSQASASVNVQEEDVELDFTQSSFTEQEGDKVEVTISLEDQDDAYVFLGSEDVNYLERIHVEDDNEDGQVNLTINTFLVGQGSGASSTGDSDSNAFDVGDDDVFGDDGPVTRYHSNDSAGALGENQDTDDSPDNFSDEGIDISSALDDPIGAGTYDLTVASTGEIDADDDDINFPDEEDVATLNLQSRSTDGISIWSLPQDSATFDEDDLYEEIEERHRRSKAAVNPGGDRVVIQVNATGLYGYVDDEELEEIVGNESLSGVSQNEGVALYLEESEEATNQDPKNFDLLGEEGNKAELYVDEDNDTFFAVIDLRSFPALRDGNDAGDVEDGEKYDVVFQVGIADDDTALDEGDAGFNNVDDVEESPYVDDDEEEVVATQLSVVETDAEFNGLDENDELLLSAEDGVVVTGTTTVAPETNLSVRLRSEGNFLLTAEDIEPGPDGNWRATFDLSNVEPGSNFTATVRRGGTELSDEVDGQVLGPASASVSFNSQDSPNGETVVVRSVTMSRGGFVAIHSGSASGPVIGSSKFLGAGTHSNVRISLDEPISEDTTLVAMPHRDDNHNNVYEFPEADGPYTADGAAVTDSATVSYVEGGTVTVTAESPTPMIVTRTVQAESPTPREVEVTRTVTVTQTPGQPGFGVAIAVVALLAAALLALRRRD